MNLNVNGCRSPNLRSMLTHFITFFLDFTWIKSTVELEHRSTVTWLVVCKWRGIEWLWRAADSFVFFWRHRLHLLALSWQPRRGPYHVMQFGRETKAKHRDVPSKIQKVVYTILSAVVNVLSACVWSDASLVITIWSGSKYVITLCKCLKLNSVNYLNEIEFDGLKPFWGLKVVTANTISSLCRFRCASDLHLARYNKSFSNKMLSLFRCRLLPLTHAWLTCYKTLQVVMNH